MKAKFGEMQRNEHVTIKINWDFLKEFVNNKYSSNNLESYFGKVLKTLQSRKVENILIGELKEVFLPSSESKIVKKNNGKVFAFRIDNFADVFKKDSSAGDDSRKNVNCFFCDILRDNNKVGMLTTDELPAYGITQADKDSIDSAIELSGHDVGMIFCLPKAEAERSRELLASWLKKIFEI